MTLTLRRAKNTFKRNPCAPRTRLIPKFFAKIKSAKKKRDRAKQLTENHFKTPKILMYLF